MDGNVNHLPPVKRFKFLQEQNSEEMYSILPAKKRISVCLPAKKRVWAVPPLFPDVDEEKDEPHQVTKFQQVDEEERNRDGDVKQSSMFQEKKFEKQRFDKNVNDGFREVIRIEEEKEEHVRKNKGSKRHQFVQGKKLREKKKEEVCKDIDSKPNHHLVKEEKLKREEFEHHVNDKSHETSKVQQKKSLANLTISNIVEKKKLDEKRFDCQINDEVPENSKSKQKKQEEIYNNGDSKRSNSSQENNSEKENFDVKVNDDGDDDGIFCSICQSTDGDPSDPIVFCDGCDLTVHSSCYGNPLVKEVPSGDWFCSSCLSVEKDRKKNSCCLCPVKGGALKPTVDGKWAHLLCALLVPEVFFVDAVGREGIDCSRVPEKRWKGRCYICESGRGCVIDCSEPKCSDCFHVSCGSQQGLHIEFKEGKNGGIVVGFCKSHTQLWKKQQLSGKFKIVPREVDK